MWSGFGTASNNTSSKSKTSEVSGALSQKKSKSELGSDGDGLEYSDWDLANLHTSIAGGSVLDFDESSLVVSDEDMNNPEYLNLLKELCDEDETVDSSGGSAKDAIKDTRTAHVERGITTNQISTDLPAASASASASHFSSTTVTNQDGELFIEPVVEVTDDDLNDPTYLGQLEELLNDKNEKSFLVKDAEPPLRVPIKPSRQSFSYNDRVQSLKEEAVAYSRAGHTAIAKEKLREAKVLVNDGEANEKRVIEVRSIIESSSSRSPSSTAPHGTALEARQRAVQLKRSNRLDEAVLWIRYAKRVDEGKLSAATPVAQSNSKPIKTSSGSASSSQGNAAQYDAVIEKFTTAKKLALEEAKLYKASSSTALAVSKMRQVKEYDDVLIKLNNLRSTVPLPLCPSVSVMKKRLVIPAEINTKLSEDGFSINIDQLINFSSILQPYINYTISIQYNLSIPIDNPIQASTTPVKITNLNSNNLLINYRAMHNVPRKSSYMKILGRKKIQFTIILHRGYFLSDIVLGIAYLPLAALIDSNRLVSNAIELLNEETNKAIPGCLTASIDIRYPYNGSTSKTVEESVLEISSWPSIDTTTIASSHIREKASSGENDARFEMLSGKEKADPLNIDLYVSNDVIEREIERLSCLLESTASSSIKSKSKADDMDEEENDRANNQIRCDILNVKLAVLVGKVQREEISLDDYIGSLQAAVERDKLLAHYCSLSGRKEEALLVMRRVLTMEKEIASASEVS